MNPKIFSAPPWPLLAKIVVLIASTAAPVSRVAALEPVGPPLYCELNVKDAKLADTERFLMDMERRWLDRAIAEYSGARLNPDLSRYLWDGVRRFWYSHYRRAELLLGLHRAMRVDLVLSSQLQRLMREALVQFPSTDLEASVAEVPAIQAQVTATLRSILLSPDDPNGFFLGEGIDLYAIHERATKVARAGYETAVDGELSTVYQRYLSRLESARAAQGLPRRKITEHSTPELEVAFPLYKHELTEARGNYSAKVNEDGPVSYRIKRSRTVMKTTGTGKDRRTTLETEYYWTTTTPTWRRIIQSDFEEAHGTTGLNVIEDATDALSANEGSFLRAADQMDTRLQGFFELRDRLNLSSADEAAEIQGKVLESIRDLAGMQRLLESRVQKLRDYAAWTNQQIHEQWALDDVGHFRARNAHLLERYEAAIRFSENIHEQLRRGNSRFEPHVIHPDYAAEMNRLRKFMWQNNIVKAIGAAAAGGAIYYYREDILRKLDELTH